MDDRQCEAISPWDNRQHQERMFLPQNKHRVIERRINSGNDETQKFSVRRRQLTNLKLNKTKPKTAIQTIYLHKVKASLNQLLLPEAYNYYSPSKVSPRQKLSLQKGLRSYQSTGKSQQNINQTRKVDPNSSKDKVSCKIKQILMQAVCQKDQPFRAKTMGQGASRFFKKENDQSQGSYHSTSKETLAKPKTPALCKRMNHLIRRQSQSRINQLVKLESFRSRIFNSSSHKQFNTSIHEQRGTILSKVTHKTIVVFKNTCSSKRAEVFLVNKNKVALPKPQRKHLLDRLLTRLQ